MQVSCGTQGFGFGPVMPGNLGGMGNFSLYAALYVFARHASGRQCAAWRAQRMGMRRFTCLPNGVSKKIENIEHAVALHFMYYNFGGIHKTLRVTPAMEAGLSAHVWSLEEIAALAG